MLSPGRLTEGASQKARTMKLAGIKKRVGCMSTPLANGHRASVRPGAGDWRPRGVPCRIWWWTSAGWASEGGGPTRTSGTGPPCSRPSTRRVVPAPSRSGCTPRAGFGNAIPKIIRSPNSRIWVAVDDRSQEHEREEQDLVRQGSSRPEQPNRATLPRNRTRRSWSKTRRARRQTTGCRGRRAAAPRRPLEVSAAPALLAIRSL